MCSFHCNSEETQNHIFLKCGPIQARIGHPVTVNLSDIYGPVEDQIQAIQVLNKIDILRKSMKEDL